MDPVYFCVLKMKLYVVVYKSIVRILFDLWIPWPYKEVPVQLSSYYNVPLLLLPTALHVYQFVLNYNHIDM